MFGRRRFVTSSRVVAAMSLVVGLMAAGVAVAPPARADAIVTPGETGLSDPSILTVHQGNLVVETDGAVIENREIRGSLTIRANNVTVRNVWVYTTSFWTVYVESGSLLIENSEIGSAGSVGERGIGGDNIVGRYLDIHHVEDGVKLGDNMLLEHVWIHDLDSNSPSPHADAIQGDGGSSGSTIRYSILDSTGPLGMGNAAALIETDLGPISNVVIENSYLNGGNYTLFVLDGNDGYGKPTGVEFLNNTFGLDNNYGWLSTDSQLVWEGNYLEDGRVLDSSGVPISGVFSDDDGNPHEANIEKLAAAGITNGCGQNLFCPGQPVTRAEMAVFLVRALGAPPGSGSSFSDVPAGAWYAGSVQRLYELGLTDGCSPTQFCPGSLITRAEMAALLTRATGGSPIPGPTPFADVSATAWYAGYTTYLAQSGITLGCSTAPAKFCPAGAVTRAEMASFLVRAFNL